MSPGAARHDGPRGPRESWWSGSFLGGLAGSTRDELLRLGDARRYQSGAVLMEQGAAPDAAMVILTGRVKVTARGEDGRVRLLAFRGAGDVVGELGVLDGRPRSATVVASGRVTALRLDPPRLRSFLTDYADARDAMTRTIIAKLRMATDRRVSFDHRPVLVRVARRLLDQADFDGVARADGILVRLTQRDLSELTGAAGPSVEKALRELRDPGRSAAMRRLGIGGSPVIRAVSGKITILNRAALETVANS